MKRVSSGPRKIASSRGRKIKSGVKKSKSKSESKSGGKSELERKSSFVKEIEIQRCQDISAVVQAEIKKVGKLRTSFFRAAVLSYLRERKKYRLNIFDASDKLLITCLYKLMKNYYIEKVGKAFFDVDDAYNRGLMTILIFNPSLFNMFITVVKAFGKSNKLSVLYRLRDKDIKSLIYRDMTKAGVERAIRDINNNRPLSFGFDSLFTYLKLAKKARLNFLSRLYQEIINDDDTPGDLIENSRYQVVIRNDRYLKKKGDMYWEITNKFVIPSSFIKYIE